MLSIDASTKVFESTYPLKCEFIIPYNSTSHYFFMYILLLSNYFYLIIWNIIVECHNHDHDFMKENMCTICNKNKINLKYINRITKMWVIQQVKVDCQYKSSNKLLQTIFDNYQFKQNYPKPHHVQLYSHSASIILEITIYCKFIMYICFFLFLWN